MKKVEEKTYTLEEIKNAFYKALREPGTNEKEKEKITNEIQFSILLNGILIESAFLHYLGVEKQND